jgi:hypothetical protein
MSSFGGTIMAKSTILIGVAAAALMAATAATMAKGTSHPSSPVEKAATASLNRKILGDNAAEEAGARARQGVYDQQVKQQQSQYEEDQKRTYEQQKAYDQQVSQQYIQYQGQIRTYEQQKAQYEQQLKNARFNTDKQQQPQQ